jgi:hypothetical protein
MKWILVKDFKIDPETTFDDETMRQIREREGGTKNPYGVQKDAERHAGAKERISSQGIPKEPIILIKKGDKYALAEGWHRTIQLLNLYPDGFTYPNVYVGISK